MPDVSCARPGLPKTNVLLVDDQPGNLLAVQVILEPLGQNLVTAQSGEEAVRLLSEQEFAVVVLDVQMPGLDGFQTAQRIRGRDASRRTPIIFVTAYESEEFPVVKAYQLGAVDYLVKPLVPEIVQAKVSGFVELFQKTEQIRFQAQQLEQAERQERKRLEAALRDSEERHRVWVHAVKDFLIFLLDAEGLITSWNEGGQRLTGYAMNEVIAKPLALLFIAEDREAGKPEQELATAIATGSATDENWIQRKDGSRFWASGYLTALRDEDGRLRGFVKICRDLTEKKRLEDTLRHQAAELAEAARRRDGFLAMLSHELRNPLGPIRNTLQVLQQRGEDPATLSWCKEVLERQVKHMTRLIDELLDVTRIAQGKITIEHQRLDLCRLTRATVEDYRLSLEKAGTRLRVDVPAEPVWVVGDATRLTQVLGNLLDNARKFSDAGGEVRVELVAKRAKREAVLRVRDQGIGLSAEILPRIFDLFEQADSSLARSRGGLGVGLALVKALVEMHGGRVQAESAGPHAGAVFTVWLPLAESATSALQAPGPHAKASRPLRILIVEDHDDAAQAQRLVLEGMGHQVEIATCGQVGIEVARRRLPDVVLCDLGLPSMDGYQVARTLRQDPATAHIRLIAISGYGTETDQEESRKAGFDVHLIKPVEPEQLLKVLAAV